MSTMIKAMQCSLCSFLKQFYGVLIQWVIAPLLLRMLADFIGSTTEESLEVAIDSGNLQLDFGESVLLIIHNPLRFCLRLFVDFKMGLAESYMAGDWEAKPSPKRFLELLIRSKRGKKTTTHRLPRLIHSIRCFLCKFSAMINSMHHKMRKNTVHGSAKNIRDHYDLGNEMFQLFLDPSMTYSCGIFKDPSTALRQSLSLSMDELYEAQMRKFDDTFETLQLSGEHKVLEIGSGWGACATRAAKKFGCQWTCITNSREQYLWTCALVAKQALLNKVQVKLMDYRSQEIATGYDKILAIEMLEAVGHDFLATFFQTCNKRLRTGGHLFLQVITCKDAEYDRYRKSSDFIKKYIFPGGNIPSVSAIRAALPPELKLTKIRSIGSHYAPTLDIWRSAWVDNRAKILSSGRSKKFFCTWDYYFSLCSALFAMGNIDTVQILIEKVVLPKQ